MPGRGRGDSLQDSFVVETVWLFLRVRIGARFCDSQRDGLDVICALRGEDVQMYGFEVYSGVINGTRGVLPDGVCYSALGSFPREDLGYVTRNGVSRFRV